MLKEVIATFPHHYNVAEPNLTISNRWFMVRSAFENQSPVDNLKPTHSRMSVEVDDLSCMRACFYHFSVKKMEYSKYVN